MAPRSSPPACEAVSRPSPSSRAGELAEAEPPRLASLLRIALLKGKGGDRVLPIWIGAFDGDALALREDDRAVAGGPRDHRLTALVRRSTFQLGSQKGAEGTGRGRSRLTAANGTLEAFAEVRARSPCSEGLRAGPRREGDHAKVPRPDHRNSPG